MEYSEILIGLGMVLYGAFVAHLRSKKREPQTTTRNYTPKQIAWLEIHAKKSFRLEREAQQWRIRAEACEEVLKSNQ